MWNVSGKTNYNRTSNNSTSTTNYSETESYNRGDYDTTALLNSLADQTQAFDLDFVSEQANARAARDTQGAVSNIFRQYQETALPDIFNAQTSTGAYGTSSAQLLANDAFSRALNQSAELQLGVASSYVGQALSARDQLLSQFSQLLQANLNQSGTTTKSGTSTTKGRTLQKEFGHQASGGYGMGAGGGGFSGGGG